MASTCTYIRGPSLCSSPRGSIFGRVVSGLPLIQQLGNVPTSQKDRPLSPVVISNCGELELRKKAAPAAAPCMFYSVVRATSHTDCSAQSRALSRSRSISRSRSASVSSEDSEVERRRRRRARKEEKRAKKERERKLREPSADHIETLEELDARYVR